MRRNSFVDRLTQVPRPIGLGVAALLAFAVISGIVFLFITLGGGGDETGGGAEGEAIPEWMAEMPMVEGADGVMVPDPDLIEAAVQATIEAIPTPTPLPTPDIGATLQAEMAGNRQSVQPVIWLNPLDVAEVRDPYLTQDELLYFRELGPRLWAYTKIWFLLQLVLSLDIPDWDGETLALDLALIQELRDTAPAAPDDQGGVGSVVRAYSDAIESGISGIEEAMGLLTEAVELLESVDSPGHAEREELIRISREIEGLLAQFDGSMSTYGCSVCGELFRAEDD